MCGLCGELRFDGSAPEQGVIERMKQNLEVFDFELTLEEMAVISAQENPTGRFWDADEIDF